MNLSRRNVIAVVGGGVIAAASLAGGYVVTRTPKTARLPWRHAGQYADVRRNALSYALLAPNPHNRQPWMVDLGEADTVVLYADPSRLLPETDPFNRQITIGLGCFLELMVMAAAAEGYRVDLDVFPEGQDASGLDARPVAWARFSADRSVTTDPLFDHVLARRSLREPFDMERSVSPDVLKTLTVAASRGSRFGGSVAPEDIFYYRALTRAALLTEIETPRTYRESVDLFRIGYREVDANPDGIHFTGPLFEALHTTGLFTRDSAVDTASNTYKSGIAALMANTDSAMGHVWLVTRGNSRSEQIQAGRDWVRVNLAATAIGLGLHPLSQALQEYPEVQGYYTDLHERLAPTGGTVQMFGRIGYGPSTKPSPRWPLETRIVET